MTFLPLHTPFLDAWHRQWLANIERAALLEPLNPPLSREKRKLLIDVAQEENRLESELLRRLAALHVQPDAIPLPDIFELIAAARIIYPQEQEVG